MKRGLFVALVALMPVAASAQDESAPGFLNLRASHTLLANSEAAAVNVGLFERRDDRNHWEPARDEDVWFQGIFSRRGWSAPRRFRYTDGRRCPAAIAVLRQVRRLQMPRPILPIPDPERAESEGSIYLDGRIYELRVQSADLEGQSVGSVTMSSNWDTELAAWSERFLTALEPCWSRTVPENMDSSRGTDDDALANGPARRSTRD